LLRRGVAGFRGSGGRLREGDGKSNDAGAEEFLTDLDRNPREYVEEESGAGGADGLSIPSLDVALPVSEAPNQLYEAPVLPRTHATRAALAAQENPAIPLVCTAGPLMAL
jgi:hypothetical protein